jgi:2-ketocyclohexanecarboxyl-CoA hydrolase
MVGLPIEEMQSAIRDCCKVVIARVQGFAIGGGNVFATLCDLTIASEKAQFGQVGPKVGSVDPGFGTAYLARVVGEKRAREMWFTCRRVSAQEAYEWGLANKVVPHDQLDAECEAWATTINEMSPTALAIAKRSFNADSENIRGISFMGVAAVKGYYQSDESKEGVKAFNEKRKPDFKKYS